MASSRSLCRHVFILKSLRGGIILRSFSFVTHRFSHTTWKKSPQRPETPEGLSQHLVTLVLQHSGPCLTYRKVPELQNPSKVGITVKALRIFAHTYQAHCHLVFVFVFNFKFYFIFKLYITVLVLPNIKMNPPEVYMCSPSWTLLPPPSPFHPSGSSQCTSPKHPASCIEPGLATRFIHDILHVSMPFTWF